MTIGLSAFVSTSATLGVSGSLPLLAGVATVIRLIAPSLFRCSRNDCVANQRMKTT
jgi:hypothetical protein